MDELTKTELALYGAVDKIEKMFIIREFDDIKIGNLKMYIEYYEQLKEQINVIKKERASEA
ncbi:MAG: hypothetical protein NC485_14895 [Ruminococcus flavefaciens]|nr:hypothetical protein [Ruminococcus flavefaciens]